MLPTTWVGVAVTAALVLWLSVSILNQFQPAWLRVIAGRDVFALLPYWTFFAPNPGQSDYHLVYRDRFTDGTLGDWQEIEITERRTLWSFVWNPEKRRRKILSDVVTMLGNHARDGQAVGNEIMLTLPYLLLLNVISQLPRLPEVSHRQFVVVETFGFTPTDTTRVILRSDFHTLATTPAA